ncbi:MAG: PQQ-dependent sugar dehydrogenase [Pseudomonadota bacterium]
MIRTLGLFAALATLPAFAGAEIRQTSAGPVEVTLMAEDLDTPWAHTHLPGGGVLITERDGRIWHFDQRWERQEVAGVPDVRARGQGGLLDVVAARDFAETREVFLTYSEPRDSGAGTALAVARLSADGGRLEDLQVIFQQREPSSAGRHFGSRVVEADDGTLFLTVGDRADRELAQDLSLHHGKVLRVNRDGSVPADNPFVGDGDVAPEIWSYGHRNPQGAALDEDGRLWTISHGARGGDEVNRPEPGKNYGWPVISYGTHYSGFSIGDGTAKVGMEQPLFYWDPSIAPSGAMIYSGRLFPDWAGDIFTGSLKFDHLSRLDRQGSRIADEERLFAEEYTRIRDVREGLDGAIWFLSVGDDALYRVTPAE